MMLQDESYSKSQNERNTTPMMKNKENMQPTVNPKPLNIQRLNNRNDDGKTETVVIRNVSISPRDLLDS